jgi:flagellar biosynthesis protein FlhF
MHVKRLYRPTVREALTAAREELGPGALVLSTEFVPAPGWRGWLGQRVVRLTAATERPDVAGIDAARVSADRTTPTAHRHLRLSGAQAGVVARLQAAGLDAALAQAVAGRMTPAECRGGSDTALRRALAAELASLDRVDEASARCEVFVGPPGVGKTTTIAKLAAQARAAGASGVRVIAADAFRAGAVEQLRGYASVIGVPFHVARGAGELDRALASTRQTALVDTAGRSPADPAVAELFDVLGQTRGVRTHLVLPADTAPSTARRVLDRYAPVKPSCVVITRLDEAESAIPLFNAVRERGLPISWLAAGQRVPEDLWRATPATLAAALLHEPVPEMSTCL